MYQPKGTLKKYEPYETRRDVRRLDTKIHEALLSHEGGTYLLAGVGALAGVSLFIPFGGELTLLTTWALSKAYMYPEKRIHNFPWRIPKHAKLFDGSKNLQMLSRAQLKKQIKHEPHKLWGEGVTYYGYCRETGMPVYATNSDDRTHLTCLGTTGSGKTEFLLGLVANQLIQNSGLIYVDAKGDVSLQRDVSRLARRFGRDDDILTINLITSGRNLAEAQPDKVTNTFNMMANTSDGMLIELLNNLLDDSSGGGGDMWKGRAMAFISALTKVLTYLRDRGFIQLSPSSYIQYMELSALEELVFEHEGKYGDFFPKVASSLINYVTNLPGYNTSEKARKKQEQKTLEQHGFIVMQLTRALNILTYDYGHIFGVQQGDIDIFDCVLNRRILTIPLPALERAPDSLKMLGKLCIGSVKQMMAGSLGNRIEGLVREILDSRPTNAPNAFKLIFDEFGYMVVSGASVMPAQGRSLSFSICFAAQDFSDIKRGNEHEAEAIWGNSNVKAIGKIVTGDSGDTMQKVNGVTGEKFQARAVSTDYKAGDFGDSYTPSANIQIQKERILPYDDLAGQAEGEFTLLVSKKEDGGAVAGVKVIRIAAFYVAGPALKYLRMNDLCPNNSIPKERLQDPNGRINLVAGTLLSKSKNDIGSLVNITQMPAFKAFNEFKEDTLYKKSPIDGIKAFLKLTLDQVVTDEQHFASSTEINFDGVNHAPHPDYEKLDEVQSEMSDTLAIGEIVSNKQAYSSKLIDKFAKDSKVLESNDKTEIDVKQTLADNVIEPINIFKLMKYATECEARLKQHKIQITTTNAGLNLLPFVPSLADDSIEVSEALKSRLRSLENNFSKRTTVSEEAADEANSLFSEIGFDAIGLAASIEVPIVAEKDNNMEQILSLVDLALMAKSQIKVK